MRVARLLVGRPGVTVTAQQVPVGLPGVTMTAKQGRAIDARLTPAAFRFP